MVDLGRAVIELFLDIAREKGTKLRLSQINFSGIDLSKLDFSGLALSRAYFRGARLNKANFSGAILGNADLSHTDLSEANLDGANLSEANLRGAILAYATLNKVNLNGADLSNANLQNANLQQSDVNMANFVKANLSKANLRNSSLIETTFLMANLNEASLTHANLWRTTIVKADLNYTDFTGAKVGSNTFTDVDLSQVKGFDTLKHIGPSEISVSTIYRSKGEIPEAFLRGCGLSDWEIEATKLYQPDLTSAEFTDITYKIHELRITAIQYYSCFISHSSKDEAFAERLHDKLQEKGVRCWFAPKDMKIGDRIRPAIDQSIRIHDKLLIILSEYSINSTWVEKEVETAFEEEAKRKQTVLLPVRLDEAVMDTDQAWAADIRRTRNIGDFSRWKDHDAYQQAFERLLRDLKAEG